MPRVSLMRERGVNSVSVVGLMSVVALRHGGFYGHFNSKDAVATAGHAVSDDFMAAARDSLEVRSAGRSTPTSRRRRT